MANEEHVKIIKKGVSAWNQWREDNQNIQPDLSEADLRAENLANANLSDTLLNGAKLVRTSLIKANLTNANLNNAKLRWANLKMADLTGAELVSAEFYETTLDTAKLDKANLSKADFSKAQLHSASLNGANLSGAKFIHADLRSSKFEEADLANANFESAILLSCRLLKAKLNGANLTRANLTGANLIGSSLEETNLSEAQLPEIKAQRVDFSNAKINGANFFKAIADEDRFGQGQLSNEQRKQLGFSVEITVKQTTPEQTDQRGVGGDGLNSNREDVSNGGEEMVGQRPKGEDEDRFKRAFMQFLMEEKGYSLNSIQLDRRVTDSAGQLRIDLVLIIPETEKIGAIIEFNNRSTTKMLNSTIYQINRYKQALRLPNIPAYIVCPTINKSRQLFEIYKVMDEEYPLLILPKEFPSFEELKQKTVGKKLTISNFKVMLDVDGIEIFNKVINLATSSNIGLYTDIPDESYINLRLTGSEGKSDNVALQIHRYGEYETTIALAVVGAQKGTEQKEPELNDFIVKGNITKLSGYKKGIRAERAWLNGNLPAKGAREKATVYVIEREILKNPGAWGRVEDLFRAAKKILEKEKEVADERMSEVELREATIGAGSVSDQPTKKDFLGFEPYTTAISEFLSHDETKPPLTISIEGEWGSGKSSFMLQLEEKLKKKDGMIVKFSPWRHEQEESVWAAFVLTFTQQITKELGVLNSIKSYCKLLWERFNWREGWPELIKFAIKCFAYFIILIGIIIVLWAGWIPYIEDVSRKIFVSIFGTAAVIWQVLKKSSDVIGNPFKHDLKKYIQIPDYTGRIPFIEQFHKDFKKIVETYAGDRRVYVFIDDLDRCEVPKAADLMQAINLMISDDPQLVFIVGMDRQKVAAGLAVKHKELLPYLYPLRLGDGAGQDADKGYTSGLRYGYSFIEKFIQLPFNMPRPTESDIEKFLNNIAAKSDKEAVSEVSKKVREKKTKVWKEDEKESPVDVETPKVSDEEKVEEKIGADLKEDKIKETQQWLELKLARDSKDVQGIVKMAAPSLSYNPRRIKQFINLFRLQAYIAYETQRLILPESSKEGITLEQLGKFVAIALGWPLFLAAFEKDSSLLKDIVEEAEKPGKQSRPLPDKIRHWAEDRKLMDLVKFGCCDKDGKRDIFGWSTYTLSRANNVEKLLQVSPKIKTIMESPIEAGGRETGVDKTVILPSPLKVPRKDELKTRLRQRQKTTEEQKDKKKAPKKKIAKAKKKKTKKKALKREKR